MLHKVLHKRYLFKRGSTVYFRWRVPVAMVPFIDRTEIVLSLSTDSMKQARIQSARLFLAVEDLKQAFASYLISPSSSPDIAQQLSIIINRMKDTVRVGIRVPAPIVQPAPLKLSYKSSETVPTLSEVYKEFIEHKRGLGLSTRLEKEYGRYCQSFLDIVGDKAISEINRKTVAKALQAYASLPKRNVGGYRVMPIADLLKINIPSEHKVSSKTVSEFRKLVQSLFTFAVEELEVLDSSPVKGLRINLTDAKTYSYFTDSEMNKLLSGVNEFKKPWQKWVLLLGAYTGARRGELVQLRKQDLKLDSETGRHYLVISEDAGSVKTMSSLRRVPVHHRLIEEGFLEYVAAAKERVFPALKPAQVTGWFGRYRARHDVNGLDDYGCRKVFHSLRHSFITKARGAGVPVDKVQQVVGHERASSGVTDRYTHRFPLRDVVIVVDSIEFSA